MSTLIAPFANVCRRVRSLFSEELLLSASVLFLPVLYMTAALALLSGIGLGRWVFPTGLLLWGVAVVMLHREERWQRLAVTLSLFIVAFALAAWATSFILDSGPDSRTYHARAIFDLLKGVNPYWESARWVSNAYPAAHWLLSVSLMLWTQSFEASFAFTPVAVVAAFLCARRFLATLPRLSSAKSRPWRNVLAFLLAFNPIATWCFFTHHVDGLLVSTLLSVFLLMLCFVLEDKMQSRRTRLRTALYIVVLLVLLVNIKFNGPVFGGILGLAALAYGVRRGASRTTLLRLVGLGSAATIVGVALFGFFPYAKVEIRQKERSFYHKVSFAQKKTTKDIVSGFMDKGFYNKSPYEKWWISLFSKEGESWTKFLPLPPFSSLRSVSFMQGFGSLFSGSLLLCLTLVFFVRHRGAGVVLAGVMVSVLSTDASYHFRLTPQNWWLPLLFLVFLLAPDDKKSPLSRAQRAVMLVVVACLLYSSLQSFNKRGSKSVALSQAVHHAEEQGGWFVVPDTNFKGKSKKFGKVFFNYYKSGLTGVNLPLLSECPEKAETRRPIYGLMLCRP